MSDVFEILENAFGAIDFKTEPFLFEFSKYYDKEMGEIKYRQYISFKKLVCAEDLSGIKIYANEIEKKFAVSRGSGTCFRRNINIDPGYIELGKLVLASTKNYTHRIYVGKGIYAEPTLQFLKKTFAPWPFSYPDYSDKFAVDFFNTVRAHYKIQLNEN